MKGDKLNPNSVVFHNVLKTNTPKKPYGKNHNKSKYRKTVNTACYRESQFETGYIKN